MRHFARILLTGSRSLGGPNIYGLHFALQEIREMVLFAKPPEMLDIWSGQREPLAPLGRSHYSKAL